MNKHIDIFIYLYLYISIYIYIYTWVQTYMLVCAASQKSTKKDYKAPLVAQVPHGGSEESD